jgi:ribosomal protein S18 acetylase RimI-like enzyme
MRGTLTDRRYQTPLLVRGLEPRDLMVAADLLAAVDTPWRRAAGPRLGVATHASLSAGVGCPGVGTLVAERDGRVVGVLRVVCGRPNLPIPASRRVALVTAIVGRKPPGPREGYIEQLAVAPSARRTGAGAALIAAAMGFAATADVDTVTCWVHRQNRGALNLVGRAGFTPQRRGWATAPVAHLLGMRLMTSPRANVRPAD